jgi:hypothetical protein
MNNLVVFSGGAPDCAALCHKNAAQPSEAAAAVCSSSAEWRASTKAGHPAGCLQPQQAAASDGLGQVPRRLLQCKCLSL